MPKLCPLFSGSSGNSYYLESAGSGILIDCGRNAKQLELAMRDRGLDPQNIRAVFITHEHGDHISALKVFAARYKLRVYASPGTAAELSAKGLVKEDTAVETIGCEGIELDSMKIPPFHISHDCAEGYGYCIETQDGRRTAFATDTGVITDRIMKALTGCDTVVLESNHDIGMLRCGSYPYILKRRILSDRGHLSNDDSARAAARLVGTGSTRLVLAHLSRENNIPELAEKTALCELQCSGMKNGTDYLLTVLSENGAASPIIY